jgi:hypothetical protein
MKRWIVALVAVAFLAGGPALANCNPGGKCGGAAKGACSSSKAGCEKAMKAGQAMGAGCEKAMQAGCCKGMMAGGCGKAMMARSCGKAMSCGSMANCGMGEREGCCLPVSHDPSNVWYRGPAPRETLLGECCEGRDHHREHARRHEGCGSKMECGAKMGAGMNCGSKPCGAGMSGEKACPHAWGQTAWKAHCGANTTSAKSGSCGGCPGKD